ncbi:hypothetical protein X975_03001, partial [Stegodyphus mimosarum]
MNDWFKYHFIPEVRQNSVGLPDNTKIVCIVDNCSAHTSLKVFVKDNVSILLFPPNCKSIIWVLE